jgi:DNA-binding transcriptional MerR regulator
MAQPMSQAPGQSAGTTELHQIGEVANHVGLSLRTVRYYEEVGLVQPAQRTEGGFRLYDEEQVVRLELIKQMKPLGLTIQQMRELLEARDTLEAGGPDSKSAHERLGGYAALAEERCRELRSSLRSAEKLARQLREESSTED